MADLQSLFETVDTLTPEQLRELYLYIVENHVQFRTSDAVEAKPQKRILGLGAERNGYWMSNNFNDELPGEFWLGREIN